MTKKIVVITGICGGIGTETCKKFTSEYGYHIIGIDRKEISTIYTDEYYRVNLSSAKEINQCCMKIKENHQKIDALIHIAAFQDCHSIIESDTEETWNYLFNVNVKSIYSITQQLFPSLQLAKGSVVIVSSVHAYTSSKDISLYAISKSALSGLVRNFAIEWAHHQIRVNGVAPGAIDTPMLTAGLSRRGDDPDIVRQQLADRHPIKRIGKPDEIANLIFFLSDKKTGCGFLTGQTIVCDGGASIYLSTEITN